jgi:hypothetical protein
MSDYRLKIKIGDHEFEAEGAVEAVQVQFEMFKELIAGLPKNKPETTAPEDQEINPQPTALQSISKSNLDRIFRSERRIISLTISPSSDVDAVLLILYGQRHYRNNESPTGSEILDGLEQSGYREIRIGRILAGLSSEGAVIITGRHRGKRYRLTNQGLMRTEGIVRDALAKLP